MITLKGSITIRAVAGRNGSFHVGRLSTSVGAVMVKEPALNAYAPGEYSGEFTLDRLYPHAYASNGHLIVEVRASLADFVIEASSRGSITPDSGTTEAAPAPPHPDAVLFGALWPLGERVKLHSGTCSGTAFRRQRDRLKALGYVFQPAEQVWVRAYQRSAA